MTKYLLVLRQRLDELLGGCGAVACGTRGNKCGNVRRAGLDGRADVNGMAEVRLNSRITGGVGRIVQNDRFYPNVGIEAAFEGGFVIHAIVGLDHDRCARGQARVSGLKFKYTVV